MFYVYAPPAEGGRGCNRVNNADYLTRPQSHMVRCHTRVSKVRTRSVPRGPIGSWAWAYCLTVGQCLSLILSNPCNQQLCLVICEETGQHGHGNDPVLARSQSTRNHQCGEPRVVSRSKVDELVSHTQHANSKNSRSTQARQSYMTVI